MSEQMTAEDFRARYAKPLPKKASARPRSSQSEHNEQVEVVEWSEEPTTRIMMPGIELLFGIPNGGHRHKIVAMKLKAEGVRSGVPDLCLPVARGGYHGLYIEMKRCRGPRGGARNGPTEEQERWIADLTTQGYLAVVCYGADEAKNVLTNYLQGPHEPH